MNEAVKQVQEDNREMCYQVKYHDEQRILSCWNNLGANLKLRPRSSPTQKVRKEGI